MAVSSSTKLTDQQRAIVAHNQGPALVFAVAGVGKTTAMVHRIERLVRERIFGADSVTSFNKAANDEIQAALRRWPPCSGVQVKTLHALHSRSSVRLPKRGICPTSRLTKSKTKSKG